MKKLFAMLLALTMTFQLITPAWADAAVEEPEEVTEASKVVEEVEEPEEATEKSEEAIEELPQEAAATEPAQEETPAGTEEPELATGEEAVEQTEEKYRISFNCTPEDLQLVVYPAAEDIEKPVDPQDDGTYLLSPGEYRYQASLEGYTPAEGTIVVEADALVEVTLNALVQESPEFLERGIEDSGTCGENLTWLLDGKGTLVISGFGDMTETPWMGYQDQIKAILLPGGLTSIKDYAFDSCSKLRSISIPESVTSIPHAAFLRCYSLTTAELPEGLTSIGGKAFQFCNSLKEIKIPESVTEIGYDAFDNCSSLESIELPVGITRVEEGTFSSTNLSEIVIPEGVTDILYSAFSGCEKLARVWLPTSVQKIRDSAFIGCTSLKEVYYDGTEEEWAAIRFGKGNQYLLRAEKADSSIDDPIVETGSCGENAAYTLTCDGTLTISGSGKVDGYTQGHAESPIYHLCSQTVKVVIEQGITGFGFKTFVSFYKMKTMYLPKSFIDAGTESFWSCPSLTDIYYDGSRADWKRVNIGEDYNDYFLSATVHYGIPDDIQIRPEDRSELTGGSTVKLSAWSISTGKEVRVAWSLREEDEAYASITPEGLLTAEDVAEAVQITVFAEPDDGEQTAEKTIRILPKTAKLVLMQDEIPLEETLEVDKYYDPTITLSAYRDDVLVEDVQWSSSAKAVATVDGKGVVTLLKPGTAVISAVTKDGSKLTASVKLNVIYLDGAQKLTIRCDASDTGLRGGKTAQLQVYGQDEIYSDCLDFTISAKQSKIATVNRYGVVTAGTVPGNVTVTAAIKGDPLKRKASIILKALPVLVSGIQVSVQGYEKYGELTEDENGHVLTMNAVFMKERELKLPITVSGQDEEGQTLPFVDAAIRCSDSTVATVSKDGYLVIPKNASGRCLLQIQSTDAGKAETQLQVVVQDFSPRLENANLTLNSYCNNGTTIGLTECYDNVISEIHFSDERFCSSQVWNGNQNVYMISTEEPVKNGTYSVNMSVYCVDGREYNYPLTIKVDNMFPKVTVRQTEKLNLFYRGSIAPLTVSALEANITSVELTNTEDFVVNSGYWNDQGEEYYAIQYANPDSIPDKPNTKGVLNVYLEGYREPVPVILNIATVTTAPVIKSNASSSTINTALTQNLSTGIILLDKAGRPLEEGSYVVWSDQVQTDLEGSRLTLTLNEAKNTTAVIYVQESSWVSPIKLTHKINVTSKLPALKPAGPLTLSNVFTDRMAETGLVLSQSNLTLENVTLTSTAKAGTAASLETAKLQLTWDKDGQKVLVKITDPENAPKAGAYSFSCVGTLENGAKLSGGTLKVIVSAAAPKVTLSAASVKLNRFLAGQEHGWIQVSAPDGYSVVDFKEMPPYLTYEDGGLTAQLPDSETTGGTCTMYPVVEDRQTGQQVTLQTKLTLKVQTYYSEKLAASLSVKGKLDTQKGGELLYTVTKLNNCLGTVENVTLGGPDADMFYAYLDTEGSKPVVRLSLTYRDTYQTNKRYKIQFRFTACGQEFLSPMQTVKVTQTALKLTVPKTVNYYQAQTVPLRVVLMASAPVGWMNLGTKTDKNILKAMDWTSWEENSLSWQEDGRDSGNGKGYYTELPISNPNALIAGKSYTVYLEATPENNAENAKPVTVKLTVKVQK